MICCHLCGLAIPRWATQNHPLAASRDHLIPRARGGTGLHGNTKSAHICCNSYRGHHPITDALRRECRTRAEAEFRKAPNDLTADELALVELVRSAPSVTTALSALPVHERREGIVRLVTDLISIWSDDGTGTASHARIAESVRGSIASLARKYAVPTPDVI